MAHRSIKKAGLSLATFAQAATDTDKILEKPSESPPSRIITRVCTTTGHAIGEPAFCTDGIGGSPSRSVREEEGVTCNERLTKTRSVRSTLFIGHAFTLVRKNRYIAISLTFTFCNKNVFFLSLQVCAVRGYCRDGALLGWSAPELRGLTTAGLNASHAPHAPLSPPTTTLQPPATRATGRISTIASLLSPTINHRLSARQSGVIMNGTMIYIGIGVGVNVVSYFIPSCNSDRS